YLLYRKIVACATIFFLLLTFFPDVYIMFSVLGTGGIFYVSISCKCRRRADCRRICALYCRRDHSFCGCSYLRRQDFRKEKNGDQTAGILRHGNGSGLYHILPEAV